MTKPLITLTSHQVSELTAFIGDQALIDDEPTDISMAVFEESEGEGGEIAPAGLYVWFTEQPEDGRVLLTRVRDVSNLSVPPSNKNAHTEQALASQPQEEQVASSRIPDDVIQAAKSMRENDYRGPLAWARKVIDWVAEEGATEAQMRAEMVPPLQPDDQKDLERLDELFSDGEGWDLPKQRMERLADLGVIRRSTGNRYCTTAFGQYCLRQLINFPLETASEFNARQHREMLSRAGIAGAITARSNEN